MLVAATRARGASRASRSSAAVIALRAIYIRPAPQRSEAARVSHAARDRSGASHALMALHRQGDARRIAAAAAHCHPREPLPPQHRVRALAPRVVAHALQAWCDRRPLVRLVGWRTRVLSGARGLPSAAGFATFLASARPATRAARPRVRGAAAALASPTAAVLVEAVAPAAHASVRRWQHVGAAMRRGAYARAGSPLAAPMTRTRSHTAGCERCCALSRRSAAPSSTARVTPATTRTPTPCLSAARVARPPTGCGSGRLPAAASVAARASRSGRLIVGCSSAVCGAHSRLRQRTDD